MFDRCPRASPAAAAEAPEIDNVFYVSGEIFYTLKAFQVVIENWRNHYNTKRPHSALG